MIEVASLRYGVIFKKAFADIEVFTGFVRDVLNISLKIDKVETEKSFDTPIGKVQPRFDLYAEDKENRIIIDIQHERHSDHYDRFLHYHCVALLEQIKNAYDYSPRLNVYTIVIVTSGDRHKKDILISNFAPQDSEGNYVDEIAHKIIFLCPKYVNEQTPEPLKSWLEVINDSLDGKIEESDYQLSEILKVLTHIEQNDVSPEEKARMIDEYSFDKIKRLEYEKGEDKGIQQGIEQGGHKNAIKIAIKMLNQGMDKALIMDLTGLSQHELDQLDDAL